MKAPEAGQVAAWEGFDFTKEDLLAIHQPDLKDVLCLKEFKATRALYLYSFAHKTLGYELWLRDIRVDFRKRLFRTIKKRIRDKRMLVRLDNLARTLSDEISKMVDREADKEANAFEPPVPFEQALLVRARNSAQAEELVRYLEAAEVALGEVVDLALDGVQRRILTENYRGLADGSYLPAIKTYYRQRIRYLEHLVHSPGTPFYPGRPPKRKFDSTWHPATRPRRKAVTKLPWRPVYRPWAEESKDTSEANRWADHERCIAERSLERLSRTPDIGFNNSVVMPRGASMSPAPVRGSTKPQVSQKTMRDLGQYVCIESEQGLVFEKVSVEISDHVTMHGDEDTDDEEAGYEETGYEETGEEWAGDEETGDDQADEEEADYENVYKDEIPDSEVDNNEQNERDADREDGFEEDTDRKGSDASSEAEPVNFYLSPAERRRIRSLAGQGSYQPPPTHPRLPTVNGGPSWRRHYDALLVLLDQARVNNYWDNHMQDPVAGQAVSRIAAECRALAPAAHAVLRGKDHSLGFVGFEGGLAPGHAELLLQLRMEVEKARRFIWRSADDFAIGIEEVDGRRGVI